METSLPARRALLGCIVCAVILALPSTGFAHCGGPLPKPPEPPGLPVEVNVGVDWQYPPRWSWLHW